MADTTMIPPLASADEVEMTLHDIAQRHHEQEHQIAELQNLLKKAEEEIALQTRRAEAAERKLAAIDGIVNNKPAPAPVLANVPLPDAPTQALKNPFNDSFLLDKTT